MDNREGMGQFPDNYFDLAIVDPPYGIGDFNQSDAKMRVKWNDNIPPNEYFVELGRVSKRQIIWGANYYNCFSTGGGIVWYKGNMGKTTYSRCEIASVSWQKKVDYVHINWISGFYRKQREQIVHPCQKPIQLYRWILKEYAVEGWKILDTHVGSGSSLIACEREGFQYVGFEIDPDYYKAAKERIERERMQLTLALQ